MKYQKLVFLLICMTSILLSQSIDPVINLSENKNIDDVNHILIGKNSVLTIYMRDKSYNLSDYDGNTLVEDRINCDFLVHEPLVSEDGNVFALFFDEGAEKHSATIIYNGSQSKYNISDIPSFKIKLSKDGAYLLTSHYAGIDRKSYFSVYNIKEQRKINIPISTKGEYFAADFISESKCVVVSNVKQNTINRNRRNPKQRGLSKVDYSKKMPAKVYIIDLESEQVIQESNLTTADGNPFWLNEFCYNPLIVSAQTGQIYIAGHTVPKLWDWKVIPFYIISLNNDLEKLVEISFEDNADRDTGIRDMLISDSGDIYAFQYGVKTSSISALDKSTLKLSSRYEVKDKRSGKILEIKTRKSEDKHLVVFENSGRKITLIETGENLPSSAKPLVKFIRSYDKEIRTIDNSKIIKVK